jgi:hypothetical protein
MARPVQHMGGLFGAGVCSKCFSSVLMQGSKAVLVCTPSLGPLGSPGVPGERLTIRRAKA